MIFSICITIVSSIVRMHSGYYQHGKLVTDSDRILKRYIDTYLFSDCLVFVIILYCIIDYGDPV